MKKYNFRINLLFILCLSGLSLASQQSFYLGADLSYVNEMEDCGVEYFDDQQPKDPYAIFGEYGGNLVRLRLWHSPSWYDSLNSGRRYSDLADVKKSIARAKGQDMNVLLDFHLSDNWADPSKQLVPEAWLPVVDDTEVLKDSLYNYIYNTLSELEGAGLLPELVQIGNETNKGILLSPQDNAVWTLDWARNAILFNSAIKAVRDFEQAKQRSVEIVLHIAGPKEADWLAKAFVDNGVTDFDIIGLSYYWAWHMPMTIEETGRVIRELRSAYPSKEVLIVETGYIWTREQADGANNIIDATHPDYAPASPEHQRDWLIDLTREVIASDGSGVLYWEPCWVSSPCYTQWGQGSHQEHAAFFDFDKQLLIPGGIEWMRYDYGTTSLGNEAIQEEKVRILFDARDERVTIKINAPLEKGMKYMVLDSMGKQFITRDIEAPETSFQLGGLPFGIYTISVMDQRQTVRQLRVKAGVQ